uniref:Uncharacterized protein n=1 Tax=Strigamia maritima TaxID=126957 RepID=T1IWT7_STRMM
FVNIYYSSDNKPIHIGGTIRCYECTSFPGSGCGGDFRPEIVDLVDCDILHNIYDSSDGIVIHRGCLQRHELELLNSDEMCASDPYNQDIVCRCDTDRCNDGVPQLQTLRFLGLLDPRFTMGVVSGGRSESLSGDIERSLLESGKNTNGGRCVKSRVDENKISVMKRRNPCTDDLVKGIQGTIFSFKQLDNDFMIETSLNFKL